jgi:protein-tyrosine phosphatase
MPAQPQNGNSRLPLQTLYNARDLGGLATADGGVTAYGRFIRSDAPVRLSPGDLQFLLDYPVRTVIDLRCDDEMKGKDHSLRDRPEIDFHHIPILGDNIDDAMNTVRLLTDRNGKVSLASLYIYAMEKAKPQFGRVFSTLAAAGPGAILFHCSLGKDRAGLVSTLLLLLAKVSEEIIIEQYAISSVYLKPLVDSFINEVPREELHFFYTHPENMRQALDHFHQEYASPEAYLSSCGLSAGEIEQLRVKLL